jgi:hypothetical protein
MPSDAAEYALPRSAILACDARVSPTCYADDQVWEIQLGGREPGLLAVQTTYGLRARLMRVFPRFSSGISVLDDPATFFVPPRFSRIEPGSCTIEYSPFFGLDVVSEVRVPGSQVLVGRMRLTNHNPEALSCRMELAAQLNPIDGEVMNVVKAPVVASLRGRTGNLYPVLFLTGGPEPGSGLYPSLSLDFRLGPGVSRQVMWALASTSSPEESFDLARKITARPWDAESARDELQDRHDLVTIQTGDAQWDAVLAHSQRAALRLFLSGGAGLPCRSFVLARTPEQGYSRRGDGSDYNYLSNGQTALDALHLSGILLPGGAQLIEDLLRNFLAAQSADGSIDWKPGLAGQRSGLLAQPVLAELAWRVYGVMGERHFLAEVYPRLSRSLAVWFMAEHDRDQDGYPEWDHLVQTGLEDSPMFNSSHAWAQGVNLACVESPGLGSLLYNECRKLAEIAGILGEAADQQGMTERAEALLRMLQSGWDAERSAFTARDRDTHASSAGEALFHGQGPSEVRFDKDFDPPCRVVIRVRIGTETTRPVRIRVVGRTDGQSLEEVFTIRDMQWVQHQSCLTTQSVYATLARIELDGFDPLDDICIETVDYHRTDISGLLALWAGVATPEQAGMIVQKSILAPEGYGQPYGLPLIPGTPGSALEAPRDVSVQWNGLVLEGLVRYGYRQEAAEIIGRLMRAMTASYTAEGSLHPLYDAFSGRPGGERDHLAGLFPVRTFLDVLGVRPVSGREVLLAGNNPFSGPVTVKYRGMKVFRQATQTLVTFPDGQTSLVTTSEPQRVKEIPGPQLSPAEKENE